jgi:hypothetical protein
MATQTEALPRQAARARARDVLTSGWPLLAVAVVWLTTAGHTLNFREMNAAKGWVSAEAYSLHSAYLLAVGLTLLACPRLARPWGARPLTLLGLGLFVLGSAVNGLLLNASLEVAIAGRVMAGIGGGLVLYGAPELLNPNWAGTFTWAAIALPPLGPAVIAGASFLYGWSSWEGGFLFEGVLALLCLGGVAVMPATVTQPSDGQVKQWPLSYLPWLVLAVAGFWYCLHWGQLQGWLESPDVLVALALGAFSLVWALWLLGPILAGPALRENWLRLVLMAFGGVVQFFHGTTMTIYSGLFINYSVWQRSWLVWSMPLGVAAALGIATLWLRRARLGLGGALCGLLLLASGMYLLNRMTTGWPFWLVQNTGDLNWFQAPLHWQQAPGRLLVGFGLGLLLASVTATASRSAPVELCIRQLFPVLQTVAGGLSIGLLVTWLLVGRQVQYSYVADSVGTIQAQELAQRLSDLRQDLIHSGIPPAAADRQALSLVYRAVNYQADNLVYADIYGAFATTTLALAGIVLCAIVWRRLRHQGPLLPLGEDESA